MTTESVVKKVSHKTMSAVDITRRMQDPNHTCSCDAGDSRLDPNR
jgi:hypothetical protein